MRNLLSIRFAIEGDLRFISHHDTLRMWARVLSRADVPVRRSEGFNPRPRLSVVLPRNVGVASCDERLVVELAEPMCVAEVARRLTPQLPGGLRLLDVAEWTSAKPPQPRSVGYELRLRPDEITIVQERADWFRSQDKVVVERRGVGAERGKPVDVRFFVTDVHIDADRLAWTQQWTPQGTAKPGEVLEALGLSARDHLHRLQRTRVVYDPE